MDEQMANQAAVAREPKWISQTQVIQNQICEATETAIRIASKATFILRLAPPKELQASCEQVEPPKEAIDHRKSVTDAPLSLRLEDLQKQLLGLNGELSELLELIDV